MFGSFISKGTGLAVSVKPADPTVAQAQLENGTFDALITVGLYEHPSDTCVKLGTFLTGIVVTKSHPLAKKTHCDAFRSYGVSGGGVIGLRQLQRVGLSRVP